MKNQTIIWNRYVMFAFIDHSLIFSRYDELHLKDSSEPWPKWSCSCSCLCSCCCLCHYCHCRCPYSFSQAFRDIFKYPFHFSFVSSFASTFIFADTPLIIIISYRVNQRFYMKMHVINWKWMCVGRSVCLVTANYALYLWATHRSFQIQDTRL
jgi:hypothetical protein